MDFAQGPLSFAVCLMESGRAGSGVYFLSIRPSILASSFSTGGAGPSEQAGET